MGPLKLSGAFHSGTAPENHITSYDFDLGQIWLGLYLLVLYISANGGTAEPFVDYLP